MRYFWFETPMGLRYIADEESVDKMVQFGCKKLQEASQEEYAEFRRIHFVG